MIVKFNTKERVKEPTQELGSTKIIATKKSHGLAYPSTYLIALYFIFIVSYEIGYEGGLLGNWSYLLIAESVILCAVLAYHLFDILVFIRIIRSLYFNRDTALEGTISGSNSSVAAEIVYERPRTILENRYGDFDSWIDKTPMLICEPLEVIGEIKITIGDRSLKPKNLYIDFIGFDRYRVTMYARDHARCPHILLRLIGGNKVYVFGNIDEEIKEISDDLIIMEACKLNEFLIDIMIRIGFLIAGLSVLALQLAA